MAKIIKQEGNELTLEIKVRLDSSFFESEKNILDACNELGNIATEKALEQFDTDGSPIMIGNIKLTTKSKVDKIYQTPYGEINIKRHVYQSSKGGKTYCPLEHNARIIGSTTPKFAQQISHKYSNMNAPAVCRDLEDNHHRKIAHSYLQDVSNLVGSIACAKEEKWEYATPELKEAISSIVISVDGAFVLMREDGYREAMVGVISLYDIKGDRQHSIYFGEAPEYGKETFFKRVEQEIIRVKKQYPNALYLGIADGSKNNWTFLEKHTENQLLDFFHVTEYLAKISYAAFPKDQAKREVWLENNCKELKHKAGSVNNIIAEMENLSKRKNLTKTIRENLLAGLTYFKNNSHMMNYERYVSESLPIGSGVTEAACKTLVKQRLCCSGMRWKNQGAKIVLSLRALIQSAGRWRQFWDKINMYGVSNFN